MPTTTTTTTTNLNNHSQTHNVYLAIGGVRHNINSDSPKHRNIPVSVPGGYLHDPLAWPFRLPEESLVWDGYEDENSEVQADVESTESDNESDINAEERKRLYVFDVRKWGAEYTGRRFDPCWI